MNLELPPCWSLDQLRRQADGRVVVWASASVRQRVSAALPWRVIEPEQDLPAGTDWLVVAGGGELMDRGKGFRPARNDFRLALIPSIWGSGAEASPVIVRSEAGHKEIRIEPKGLPDVVVYWPELALTLSPQRQHTACGDCWAHALEGFLSPLAKAEMREFLAQVIRQLLVLPLAYDPRWFELSAAACAAQAQAGAGLVHGVAHTLEGPLRQQQPDVGWHHARLCSVYLDPVMRLNRERSHKWHQLMTEHGLVEEKIFSVLADLFEADSYRAALPVLQAHWAEVLRDPCTRTNSTLVRPDWLAHFERLASP